MRDLMRVVGESDHYQFPVVDRRGKIVGAISVEDIRGVYFEEIYPLVIAKDIARPVLATVTPDESLNSALRKFIALDSQGISPEEIWVVDPQSPDRILGVLRRRDILKAYAKEMEKKARA